MLTGGSISIRIEADKALLELLPDHWEDYLRKNEYPQRRTLLRIKVAPLLNDLRFSSGWSVHCLDGIEQAVFAPKGRAYCSIAYDEPLNATTIYVGKALDCFVRNGVLYGLLTALHRTCIGLHGVTLRCGNETIVLSAPSGTGKTTLALLLEEYCGARTINGDFALLSLGENSVVFEPTPFCGTSRICLNERARVDRIVFLSQSTKNIWQEIDGRQAAVHLLSNVFVPSFDLRLMRKVQSNAFQVISCVKTNGFAFEPTREAAQMFLDRIMSEKDLSQ